MNYEEKYEKITDYSAYQRLKLIMDIDVYLECEKIAPIERFAIFDYIDKYHIKVDSNNLGRIRYIVEQMGVEE